MMKKALSFVAMLGILATLTVVSVSAQTSRLMTATIPFDFTIGKKTLPAGKYDVYCGAVNGFLMVRGEDNRAKMLFLTDSAQAKGVTAKAYLVFRRYGNQYFLSQVWTPGTDIGRALAPSKRERRLIKEGNLARKAAKSEIVRIAAQ